MQFDHCTVTLLMLRPDAPEMDDAAADALQSEHLAHLAGLSIWKLEPEEVLHAVTEHPDPSGRVPARLRGVEKSGHGPLV